MACNCISWSQQLMYNFFPFRVNLRTSKNPFRASWIFMTASCRGAKVLLVVSIPFFHFFPCNTSKTLLQLRTQPLIQTYECVYVRMCSCLSLLDINRFSFVLFDSHSGWGRQINDDGNIYDSATATGAYNEWVMERASYVRHITHIAQPIRLVALT